MTQIEGFLGIPLEKVYLSIQETIYMVSISLIIGAVLAFIIGIALVFTKKGGLYENKMIYGFIFTAVKNVSDERFPDRN